MTDAQIAADVDRGLALAAQLDEIKAELKTIESRLQQAALEGVTVPLEDGEREGRQFLARGTAAVLPVRIESDQLIASFDPKSDLCRDLVALTLNRVGLLFRDVRKWERIAKDGKTYRAAAAEHFGPEVGAQIVSLTLQRNKDGIPKSRIVIPWDRAK